MFREMGCQWLSKKWWTIVLRECQPRGGFRVDKHGKRSVDTHGVVERAMGTRDYWGHAHLGKCKIRTLWLKILIVVLFGLAFGLIHYAIWFRLAFGSRS